VYAESHTFSSSSNEFASFWTESRWNSDTDDILGMCGGGGSVGVVRRATTLAGNFKLTLSDSRGREASPSSDIRYSYRRTLATREQNYPSARARIPRMG
jgi:hypothetical protein